MTIRIGILCNDTMPRWILRDIKKAVANRDIQVKLVIIDNRKSKDSKSHISEVVNGDLWKIYYKLSWKINPPELSESISVKNNSLFDESNFHHCEPKPADDIGITLPDKTVELVRKNCDLLIRTGFGIIQGEILTATKYGVLSYHHGDIRKYRGRPAGFWEYMNGDEVSGITLQQLNETLDGGEIVVFKQVDISNLRTWRRVRKELFSSSIGMMTTAIERLSNPGFNPTEINELGDLYTNPTNIQMMKFFVKNTSGYIKHKSDQIWGA